jgi:hypothetical protein
MYSLYRLQLADLSKYWLRIYYTSLAMLEDPPHILKLPDLIYLAKVKFIHNFIYNKLPSSFHDTWIRNRLQRHRASPDADAHEVNNAHHQLRSEDDIYEPLARSDQVSKFPSFNYPKILNALSPSLKINSSFNHVINELKNSFFDHYNDQFIC